MFLCIRCVVCVIADLGTPVERKCIIKHAALSLTVRWVCRNYCFLFQKSPLPKQQNTKQNHADKLRQLQWCTMMYMYTMSFACLGMFCMNPWKLIHVHWMYWETASTLLSLMRFSCFYNNNYVLLDESNEKFIRRDCGTQKLVI